jgi:NADH-quinone oxidoreductase subunit E
MKLRYAPRASGNSFTFAPEELGQIDKLFRRYPTKQAALLPVLWIAHNRQGWISRETVEEVARLLGLSPAYVDGVVTFYTMFNLEPVGRHHLQFCTSISCHLNEAEDLMEYCCRKLKIEPGGTTPDGLFTVSEVECLGGCDRAPSLQVNDRYHEPMSREKLDALLARLSKGA